MRQAILKQRINIRALTLNYGTLLADGAAEIWGLGHFLGKPLDPAAAGIAVAPELRQQKS